MTFKKQTVTVGWLGYMAKPGEAKRPVEVPAYVAGSLAIHRPLYGSEEPKPGTYGWSVSHIPTGGNMDSLFFSQSESTRSLTLANVKERVNRARRFCVALALLDALPWGFTADALAPEDRERVKALANSGAYVRTGNEAGLSRYAEGVI